jgi:hypothetical protein
MATNEERAQAFLESLVEVTGVDEMPVDEITMSMALAIIAAAESRGRAEGAAEERRRIVAYLRAEAKAGANEGSPGSTALFIESDEIESGAHEPKEGPDHD